MTSLRKLSLAMAALLALVASLPLPASAAGPVPFKATIVEHIVWQGPCPDLPGPHFCVHLTGSGQSTTLGPVTETVSIVADLASSPAPNCVNENRTSILTTASGDQVTFRGPGVACPQFNPQGMFVHNSALEQWSVTGGTGSLAGATGSGTDRNNIASMTTPVLSITIFEGTLAP